MTWLETSLITCPLSQSFLQESLITRDSPSHLRCPGVRPPGFLSQSASCALSFHKTVPLVELQDKKKVSGIEKMHAKSEVSWEDCIHIFLFTSGTGNKVGL